MSKLKKFLIWLASLISNALISIYGNELKMCLNTLLPKVQLHSIDAIIFIIFIISLAVFVMLPLHSLWRWISGNKRIKEKIAGIYTLSRKLTRTGYDFDAFDVSFKGIEQATEPKTMAKMLIEFQPKLREVCYDVNWNEEVKNRIEKVLEHIPKEFSNEPHADIYLQFVGMITKSYEQYTIKIVKRKFHDELKSMYRQKRFETNPYVVRILQRLNSFSENYLMKLTEDAGSPKIWSDQKFGALSPHIAFHKLSDESIKRVLEHLVRKMESAEKSEDQIAYKRFKQLYDLAKGSA